MPLTLDQLAEPNRPQTLDELAKPKTLDELAEYAPLFAPEDPEAPAVLPEVGPIAKIFGRGAELAEKGLWTGLGAIAVPFERMGRAIATPLARPLEKRIPFMPPVEPSRELTFGEKAKRVYGGAPSWKSVKAEWKEALPAAIAGAKALVPWPGMAPPEETRTITDLVGTLMEIEEGRKPSALRKGIFGTALDVAVTPLALGKALKGVGKVAKVTKIPQKIAKARIPAWQIAKMRARMKTGAGIERVTELGKTLSKKEATKIAKELSARTGKKIGYRAIQQRTGQIIKGGITTRPELARVANPVIEEVKHTSKLLKKLGILGEETYITKLPKKRIAELLKEKAQLAGRMQKLKEPPYRKRMIELAGKLKIKGKEKIANDLADLAMTVPRDDPSFFIRLAQTLKLKTTPPLTKHLMDLYKVGKADVRQRTQLVNKMFKLSERTLGQEISGLKPLFSRITRMKRRFPGQAKKVRQLQEKMGAITEKVQTSYKLGGTKYMPRMYRSKEEEALVRKFWGWSKHRIRAHYAKQRKNIPPEVRRMMGEIKEPAYPVMKRLVQEVSDIETAKLFNLAARHKDWVSSVPKKGFKQLDNTKAYGALRGKFVAPRIYNDVKEMTHIRNQVEQVYDTLIGSWKLGKVVLNPATHFRNKISNKILLDLSGMGYAEQTKYAVRALKEYKRNTKEYQIAKRYFARTTLIRGEILDDILRTSSQAKGTGVERAFNAVRGGIKRTMKKPAQLYQHEEFVNKFMKYLQQRDQGKSVIQAAQEANKWLFDYSALSAAEIKYARRIMPFYTFPRKAIPRVAEALAERPYTVAKYPLMAKAMTQYSLYKLDMTYDDYEQVQKVLPDYMKKGSYILMPYRDDNGDLRFFDWTYIVPWGAVAEAQERGVLKSVIQNPLLQLVGDVMRNKSSWTDREIWKETDTTEEKTWKKTEYVWRNLTPALAPKGIYWDKLYEAATGKTYRGKERLLPETVAHTILGLRTQPIDVKEQKRWRLLDKQKQLKEFYSKMAKITQQKKDGDITKEEYDKKRKQYLEQVKKLLREGKEIAGVKLE